jgi:hypothetical protein
MRCMRLRENYGLESRPVARLPEFLSPVQLRLRKMLLVDTNPAKRAFVWSLKNGKQHPVRYRTFVRLKPALRTENRVADAQIL